MGEVYRSEIPAHTDAAEARASARRWLVERFVSDLRVDVTVTVVSELVTNAVRHARTTFALSMDDLEDGDGVRIEVFDADTRHPTFMGADLDATSGRGLHIVSSLASDWGFRSEERDGIQGKVVWADLRWDEVG